MSGLASMLAGLRALGPLKLGALAAVALVSLGLVGALALHTGSEPMSLLYADLELREAGQVVEQLDKAHIAHRTEGGGTRILVPSDQVDRARMLLAKEGLPSGGSIGYEIFDRSDGLTASAFQQSISQTRALEGELGRTIRSLQGVRAARVHLVLPRREPFSRDRQDAQASVVLTMAGAARLDREGVQAVLNLIAAAVPGLKPKNIAIIDSRGNLLARAGQPEAGLAAAQSGEELKRGHGAADFPCRRGNAGTQPGRRPRSCRGHGRSRLRAGARDAREIRSRRPGRPQPAEQHEQQQEHRSPAERLGPEQPSERRSAGRRRWKPGAEIRRNDELRDQQDRPHRQSRPAATTPPEPRRHGRWRDDGRRRWQAELGPAPT